MKNDTQKQVLEAATRTDLLTFTERAFPILEPGQCLQIAPYIELLAYRLQMLPTEPAPRLIINLPPRHLKSMLASVIFPAWLLGNDPTTNVLVVSHTHGLADELAGMCRRLIASDWYRKLFPGTRLREDFNKRSDFETTKAGGRLSMSMESAITGRGADVLIVDDPISPIDVVSATERRRVHDAFDGQLSTRLNDPATAAIIIVGHRVHEDDLFGHLLRTETYEHIALPFIAEEPLLHKFAERTLRRGVGDVLNAERFPPDVLENVRRDKPPHVFETQYQQKPTAAGRSLIVADDFETYHSKPEQFDRVCVSFDVAETMSESSSYSVGQAWGELAGKHYLLDVWRDRVEYRALKESALRICKLFDPDVIIIESASTGRALISDMQQYRWVVQEARPAGQSKVERLEAHLDLIKHHRIFLPEPCKWMRRFVDEVTKFPHGRFDDQVDAMTQYLAMAKEQPLQPPKLIITTGVSTNPFRGSETARLRQAQLHDRSRRSPFTRSRW